MCDKYVILADGVLKLPLFFCILLLYLISKVHQLQNIQVTKHTIYHYQEYAKIYTNMAIINMFMDGSCDMCERGCT